MGLVVVSDDQTVEKDMSSLLSPSNVAVFASRIPMDNDVNPATLGNMAGHIGSAASLILPGRPHQQL